MAEHGGGDYTIEGPDVAIVGWIPYAYGIQDMAENAYTRHRLAPALGWLFDSGNPPPPDRFDGFGGFLGYLGPREFRGACCLRDVRLECDEAGTARNVSFIREEYIGYTPYRLAWKAEKLKHTVRYGLGQGKRGDIEVRKDREGARISRSFRFRIGALGNLGTWILTGCQAPWVGVGFDYRIDSDGRIEVDFAGSHIPSHRCYVDWVAQGGHDMLGNEAGMIDDFFSLGRDEEARWRPSLTWNGQGQRC